MTDLRQAAQAALKALESQHRDRTAYGRAKKSANATCGEFKNSPLAELIESGYMHSIGKQTQAAIDALREALAAQQDAPKEFDADTGTDTDVRQILLDVVPGDDGEGLEVYAKSVEDVVRKLSEMGERIEELESRQAAQRAAQPVALVKPDPVVIAQMQGAPKGFYLLGFQDALKAAAAQPQQATAGPVLTDDEIVSALKSCEQEDHAQAGWVWRQRVKWCRAIEAAVIAKLGGAA